MPQLEEKLDEMNHRDFNPMDPFGFIEQFVLVQK